jgi:bifunctional polynucleotide phosphatase/kinase
LESKAEGSQAVEDLPPGFRGSLVASTTQELVMFVGSPASGKSSFAQKHLVSKGYGYVNGDTLGSGAKCIKACRAFLAEGKSVVVDNTNPMPKSRSDYLSLAASAKVPARCFVFDASRVFLDCGTATHNYSFPKYLSLYDYVFLYL